MRINLNNVRLVFRGIAVFFGATAIGGFVIGFSIPSGMYLALACLNAGLFLAVFLWQHLVPDDRFRRPNGGLALVMFSLISGLAMYSNLAYLTWILGFPLSMGIVESGRMGEHYWLPPATLLYAVGMFYWLRFTGSLKG